MSEIALPSTYNEPTVMWRMTHRNGRWAQAVIDPLTSGARAQWFVNGHPLAICDFADWTSAIAWTDRLRAQQWTVGWRPRTSPKARLLEAAPDAKSRRLSLERQSTEALESIDGRVVGPYRHGGHAIRFRDVWNDTSNLIVAGGAVYRITLQLAVFIVLFRV